MHDVVEFRKGSKLIIYNQSLLSQVRMDKVQMRLDKFCNVLYLHGMTFDDYAALPSYIFILLLYSF